MSISSPRCTVVIPTYNCANYLPAAFTSIAAQNIDDVEVIVVDDGSTDDTESALRQGGEILAGVAALRTLRTDQVGPGVARNYAAKAARSPLIAFLDADDIWLPGKLEAQLALHEADEGVVLSFTDYRHRGPQGDDRGTCFEFWGHKAGQAFANLPEAHSHLLGCNLVGTSTVMASREAFLSVRGFGGEMPSSEDWDLWLKMARIGRVSRSGMVGCDYLMRPNSLTAARAKRIDAMETILARALAAEPKPNARDVRLARARIVTARAEHAREMGLPLQAVLGHAAALTLNPSVRAARAMVGDLGRLALGAVSGDVARRA